MKYSIRKKLLDDLLSYPYEENNEYEINIQSNRIIDMDQLIKLCSYGVPSLPGYRSLCWKLLLNTLPADKSLWEQHLTENRLSYDSFINQLITKDQYKFPIKEDQLKQLKESDSKEGYKKENDLKLLEQIHRDIKRTLSDHPFFTGERDESQVNLLGLIDLEDYEDMNHDNLSYLKESRRRGKKHGHRRTQSNIEYVKKEAKNSEAIDEGIELSPTTTYEVLNQDKRQNIVDPLSQPNYEHHIISMERILFIYAKLNPGVGYVQGMNEILAPLYYVNANSELYPSLKFMENAEADTFFLFTSVMSSIRDQYLQHLDHSELVGVQASLNKLQYQLKKVAPELYFNLKQKRIEPHFYAFRWIALLGSQDFRLDKVVRLWDGLFSHVNVYHNNENGIESRAHLSSNVSILNNMIMVSVAMLYLVKDQLLLGNFNDNIQLLQNYPDHIDISHILKLAYTLESLPPNVHFSLESLLHGRSKTSGLEQETDLEENNSISPLSKFEQIAKNWKELLQRPSSSNSNSNPNFKSKANPFQHFDLSPSPNPRQHRRTLTHDIIRDTKASLMKFGRELFRG